jgi:hypothetical protein
VAVEVPAAEGDVVLPILQVPGVDAARGHGLVHGPDRRGIVEVEAEVVAGGQGRGRLGREQGEQEPLVIGEEDRPVLGELLPEAEPLLIEGSSPTRVSHPQSEVVEVHRTIVPYDPGARLG